MTDYETANAEYLAGKLGELLEGRFTITKHSFKSSGYYLTLLSKRTSAHIGSVYFKPDGVEIFLMLSEKVNKRVCEFRGLDVDKQRQRGKRFLFTGIGTCADWLKKCEFKATKRKNSKWVAVKIPL